MSGLRLLGLVLIIYGGFCLAVGIFKIPVIWNMGKIKAFVKMLGEVGTQAFLGVWGAIALGIGIWLLTSK